MAMVSGAYGTAQRRACAIKQTGRLTWGILVDGDMITLIAPSVVESGQMITIGAISRRCPLTKCLARRGRGDLDRRFRASEGIGGFAAGVFACWNRERFSGQPARRQCYDVPPFFGRNSVE